MALTDNLQRHELVYDTSLHRDVMVPKDDGGWVAYEELHELFDEAAPMLRTLASQCEGCEGAGEIIRDDDQSEPCKHCAPIWKLIERIEPPRPAPVPVPAAVQEEDDDLPF